jgi:hypothetical protein
VGVLVEVVEGRITRGAKDLFFFVFFGVVKEVQANSRCFFLAAKEHRLATRFFFGKEV